MKPAPWTPSRPVTILIGILTAWPPIYFVLFMSFFFMMAFRSGGAGSNAPGGFPFPFGMIMVLHLGAMLLMFALTAVYIVHAFRTDRIADDRRLIWVVIIFFGNLVAFPVYWYLYMWRRPSGSAEIVQT